MSTGCCKVPAKHVHLFKQYFSGLVHYGLPLPPVCNNGELCRLRVNRFNIDWLAASENCEAELDIVVSLLYLPYIDIFQSKLCFGYLSEIS